MVLYVLVRYVVDFFCEEVFLALYQNAACVDACTLIKRMFRLCSKSLSLSIYIYILGAGQRRPNAIGLIGDSFTNNNRVILIISVVCRKYC